MDFAQQTVEQGSTIHTDGWRGYSGLRSHGFQHEVSVLSDAGPTGAKELLPRVHLVALWLSDGFLGLIRDPFPPNT